MGNSASSGSASKAQTQEQKDIQYLGDRMPFGDDELRRIYRCYYRIESETTRTSFLADWAIHAADTNATTDEQREERALLMDVLEVKILPPGFGNMLYATAFLKRGEASIYDNPNAKAKAEMIDEYTRIARLEQFFDGLSNCGRRGTKHAVKVLFHCCEVTTTAGDEHMVQATDLIQLAYRIALASAFWVSSTKEAEAEQEEDNDMSRFLPAEDKMSQQELTSFAKSITDHAKTRRNRQGLPPLPAEAEDKGLVSCDDVTAWVENEAPLFAATLSTLTFRIFCPGQPYPPSRTEFIYPVIPMESAFFEAGSSILLFVFACLSPALGGHFHRLYTSLSDGLSFNRLQNALLGYGGPTLMIVRSAAGDLFGAFTGSSWKESKDFYGTSDCFIFQLLPRVAVYRPSGNGNNFMYCNSFARSRGYDKQAHGIGFGGTVSEPRLFLAEAWDGCTASSRDLTFENGPLLGSSVGNSRFDLEALEVWGVGGEEVVAAALGDRKKARAVKDAAIQKARKVDKAAFLDDFRSGIIDSKAFAHRQQARGRADADLEDHDRENRRRGF